MAFEQDLQAMVEAKGAEYVIRFKDALLQVMASSFAIVGGNPENAGHRLVFAQALQRVVDIIGPTGEGIPNQDNWNIDDLVLDPATTKALADLEGIMTQFWSSVLSEVHGDWSDWLPVT